MVVVTKEQHALLIIIEWLRAGRAHNEGPTEAVHLLISRVPMPEVRPRLLIHLSTIAGTLAHLIQ